MLRTFLVTCVAMAVCASVAVAQTTPPAPNPNQGAFDKLSPGNQKIAQALFDAEQSNSTTTTSTTTKPLSRDDIAAMKQDGKGWGGVFRQMRKDGLVQEKNLGQVVSGANRAARSGPNGSGRSSVEGTKMRQESSSGGAGQNGNNHQPQFTGNQSGLSSGAGAGRSNAGGNGGRGKN